MITGLQGAPQVDQSEPLVVRTQQPSLPKGPCLLKPVPLGRLSVGRLSVERRRCKPTGVTMSVRHVAYLQDPLGPPGSRRTTAESENGSSAAAAAAEVAAQKTSEVAAAAADEQQTVTGSKDGAARVFS